MFYSSDLQSSATRWALWEWPRQCSWWLPCCPHSAAQRSAAVAASRISRMTVPVVAVGRHSTRGAAPAMSAQSSAAAAALTMSAELGRGENRTRTNW